MSLFFALLPLYLFGNLHCFGMCGPLVMMIGHHRYRYWYFLGRSTSFALAGWMAGELGAVLSLMLERFSLSAYLSFFFGVIIFFTGFGVLLGVQFRFSLFKKWNQTLSILLLNDKIWPTFLFGFFTVFLPCGQSMIVFSACALSQSGVVGFGNGLSFALLTSPALFVAMRARSFFQKSKKYGNQLLAITAIIIGILSFCRGFADLEVIPHLVLNAKAPMRYHIVIY